MKFIKSLLYKLFTPQELVVIRASLKRFARRVSLKHNWVYHNPYDRTCLVCKRHEVEHCNSWDYWHWRSQISMGGAAPGWWEVFYKGNLRKHLTK